jgi:uncharacterized protein involved in type VI secretion and phage assembly
MSSRNGTGTRYPGVYPALVTDLVDPARLGRIEVELPWLGGAGDTVRAWATLLSPYAEDDQGFQALPSVGTQVVVAFEAGDLQRPYVLGAVWNGREAMPDTPTAANDVKAWQTRSGTRIELDDSPGAPAVRISVAGRADGGTDRVVLDGATGEITVASSNGATVKITPAGGIEITATSTIDISASLVTVNAAMSQFNGIVTCDTLIAKGGGIVSPAYTPGAGNVW